MSQQVIRSKSHANDTLQYNAWMPLRFKTLTLGESTADSVIQDAIPLGVHVKILAVTALLTGSPAGTCSFNLVRGFGTFHGAAIAATGRILLQGPFNTGAVVACNFNGTTVSTTVTANQTTQSLATALAAALNANGTISALVTAYGVGNAVLLVAVTAGVTANAYTYYVTVSPTYAGTVSPNYVTNPATLSGGLASQTAPSVAPPDNSLEGVTPPASATNLQALWDTNQSLSMTATVVQNFYPTLDFSGVVPRANPDQFDAIFPAGWPLTLRVATNGSGAGTLDVTAWAVAVDKFTNRPLGSPFIPSLALL